MTRLGYCLSAVSEPTRREYDSVTTNYELLLSKRLDDPIVGLAVVASGYILILTNSYLGNYETYEKIESQMDRSTAF